jgi:hypothetical protein
MDAASQWRVYQGVGLFAQVVTQAVLSLERCVHDGEDNVPNRDHVIKSVIEQLYGGVSEARQLLPHMLQYADAMFEGSDRPSGDQTSNRHGATPSQYGAIVVAGTVATPAPCTALARVASVVGTLHMGTACSTPGRHLQSILLDVLCTWAQLPREWEYCIMQAQH